MRPRRIRIRCALPATCAGTLIRARVENTGLNVELRKIIHVFCIKRYRSKYRDFIGLISKQNRPEWIFDQNLETAHTVKPVIKFEVSENSLREDGT
jgi:hypothetical protein